MECLFPVCSHYSFDFALFICIRLFLLLNTSLFLLPHCEANTKKTAPWAWTPEVALTFDIQLASEVLPRLLVLRSRYYAQAALRTPRNWSLVGLTTTRSEAKAFLVLFTDSYH